jgi:hypothetical protein
MEVTLHIPDDVAKRLAAGGGDLSRRALEAVALEGYREHTLTLYQVSDMLSVFLASRPKMFWGDTMFP